MDGKEGSDNGGLLEISAQRRDRGSSAWLQRRLETPATPGRPVFSFSTGNLHRKSVPSKWDDAGKWLMTSSFVESPVHRSKLSEPSKAPEQKGHQKADTFGTFAKKLSLSEQKLSKAGHGKDMPSHGIPSEVLLKDKFTRNVETVGSNFRCLETSKEGFMFKDSFGETEKDAAFVPVVPSRDVGTEMTPICSLTTSRCHTPIKSSSPARHNTPADRSGPLMASDANKIGISDLRDCHFAKLELGARYDSAYSNWSSREEEEEEVSKSLRHFEMNGGRKSTAESRTSVWEDGEKIKCCMRYQREDAKIQAWVNLQTAKAEEKSRKLEMKIQKMRSNLEEKLMKRMAIVHRRAEEWRAEAQMQHSLDILKAAEQARKMRTQQSLHFPDSHASCGCFTTQQ